MSVDEQMGQSIRLPSASTSHVAACLPVLVRFIPVFVVIIRLNDVESSGEYGKKSSDH